MKQYWLMFGQTGARLARALLLWLTSGLYPGTETDLLLADTDERNTSAARAAHLGEAYAAVQALSTRLAAAGDAFDERQRAYLIKVIIIHTLTKILSDKDIYHIKMIFDQGITFLYCRIFLVCLEAFQ